jgi:putative tricarboxylic transport membrane protein
MLGFAVLGYLMRKLQYPFVPIVLGLVLGRLAENSLRQPLTLSGGSISVFFTRPFSPPLLVLAILAYLSPVIRWVVKSTRSGRVDVLPARP